MGLWNKLVNTFSTSMMPRKAVYEKTLVIQQPVSSYGSNYSSSGYYGGSRSGGAKWKGGLSASGAGFIKNHALLRQNARDMYDESTQARALVDRYADTVVDTGLVLVSAPKFEILGITPEAAEEWGAKVDEMFDSWCKDKKQHRSRTMTFYQFQRLYQKQQERDGEDFVRLFYSKKKELQNPLQFEFIDADQIRGNAYTTSYVQNNTADGIVRDDDGAAIGYKIWFYDKNNQIQHKVVSAFGSKSKRPMMLHGFEPEYTGQGRGFSGIGHILQEFENITDFTLAQIKKAITQSQISMYVKPSEDNPASDPTSGIQLNRSAGPSVQFGSDPTPSVEAVNVDTCPVTCHTLPEAQMNDVGTIGVFNLNKGEDLKPFDQKAVEADYDKFVDTFCSYLAASKSMPVEVMLMKFNQNYSASRAALILFWRVVFIRRNEMESDLLNPIKMAWMSEEIAANRIQAPGWSDSRLKAAWANANWIGSPMPNIDPQKTAKADQLYLEMGATTQNRIARNLNGSNAKQNLATNTRMFELTPESPFGKSPTTTGLGNAKASASDLAESIIDEIELRKE